jgi:hypothetical protein
LKAAVIIVFFEANKAFQVGGEKDPSGVDRTIEGTMTGGAKGYSIIG